MGSKLKIVSVIPGMKQYIHAVRNGEHPDMGKLWLKYVIDPYWDQWAAGQFNEERTRGEMSNPAQDINALEEAVNQLESIEINSLLNSSYDKVVNLLPLTEEDKTVCIFASSAISDALQGVLGACIGDSILLQINPAVGGWQDYIPWVLAHEYNHTVWGYNYYYLKGNHSHDLLTAIITEGEADSFAKAICPKLLPAWLTTLSGEQEKEQWSILQEYLHHEDDMELHGRFFFGDANTPRNTGYGIGFHIVQRYLEARKGISFTDLADKDAWEILRESGYEF